MGIEQLIAHSVPVLSPGDTVSRALDILEDHKLSGLPVVADDEYVALITEDSLAEIDEPDMLLTDTGLLQYKPAVSAYAHPFDALTFMHQALLPVLPVTDNEGRYLGSITKETLLAYIAGQSGIANPGGIIVLELPPRNYSMYEIARICENEDVILLAMHSRTNELGMLQVTLKLNRTVLDAVVSSFERHNYHVLEVYGKETNDEDIIGKYNLLMNYINM
jgi:CBS domain-containing protein